MPRFSARAIAGCLLLFVAGCASSPFKTPGPDADYGAPPENYEATVKAYFETILKDPESARFKFGPLTRAYANNGLLYGGTVGWTGYLVDVDVNAKNGFGGYNGFKRYMVLFKDNVVFRHYEGSSHVLVTRID